LERGVDIPMDLVQITGSVGRGFSGGIGGIGPMPGMPGQAGNPSQITVNGVQVIDAEGGWGAFGFAADSHGYGNGREDMIYQGFVFEGPAQQDDWGAQGNPPG